MKRKSSKRLRVEEKPADDIEKDYMAKDTESINKEFSKKFSSQKRLRINQSLTSKLHILTNAEQKFAAVLTPGRITGAKNNNLWDFKIASLQHESSPGSGTASLMSSVLNSSVLPAVERLRHRCVTESRDHLKQLCKDHDIIPPLMAWERWQANSMLQEQLRRSSDSDSNSSSCYDTVTFKSTSNNYSRKVRSPQYIVDDILPSDVKHIDRGLVQDLQRGGIREEKDAVKIALDLVIHSKKLIDKIQSFSRSCIPIKDVELRGNKKKQRQQLHQMNQAIADADLQPTIVNHKHTYDVYLGCKSKHIIKLNTAHYRKLRELFLLVHRSTSNQTVSAACSNLIVDSSTNALNSPTSVGVEGTDMGQDEVTKAFHAGLYSMLARYNALLGHGMQCALPEHVFEILHDHVKTNFECFASPLNCRYFSYCSAFPDTDAIFGSKGSFFDFFPTSGSYEVNPPFIESIMAEAVNHAHSLLSVSIDALSFVFIVPGWIESGAYQLLEKSSYLNFRLAVAAKDHGYCSGAQHQRKDRYLEAPYDTIVFILQNVEGTKLYGGSFTNSITRRQFEQDLRTAFSMAVPSEAMKQRRMKEGRGFGDLDGGGGVYRGKKNKLHGKISANLYTKTDEMYLVNLLTSSFDFFVYFGNSPNWRKVSSTGHEVTVMLCLNKFGMEGVQKVRELEQLVVADAKNANYLLVIKKQLQDEDISKEERTAALHSLRRIFIHFLESGRLESNFVSAHSNQLAVSGESGQSGKLQEYQKWLIQQFNSYQATLLKLISSNETYLQAPAIRTILEFVRREHMVSSRANTDASATGPKNDAHSWFGVRTCQSMLETLLSLTDIDVDILLLLRDEMFTKPDCSFYTLVIMRNLLRESKASIGALSADSATAAKSTTLVKNCLDMLRFISLPVDNDQLSSRKAFLVRGKGTSHDGTLCDDDDSSGDEEEDNDGAEVLRVKSNRKGGGMKRAVVPLENSSKRQKRLTRSEQLVHLPSHQKVFSKAWLALLAMPLSNAQHKVVLKHLPENVIGNLTRPLMLADYLTQSYEQGGVIAVLALEGLFQLIVKFNLDYPKFFASLYRLCNYDVLSAKYRSKFMKLLTMCLRSANMPAYLVAAFAKRLAQLSLRVPSPAALFCVAQVTWLLRQHPQCMVLVHRNIPTDASSSKSREYDALEDQDLEKCDALHSSLWEIETLSSHCLHTVSTFAKALQGTQSTSSDMDAPSLIVEDFIEHTYASLMETEAGSSKIKKDKDQRNNALAYKEPSQLLPRGDVMRQCFGSL